jgi:hypothetical protein
MNARQDFTQGLRHIAKDLGTTPEGDAVQALMNHTMDTTPSEDMSNSVLFAIRAIKNITGSPLAVKQLLAEIASMCANHEFESAHDMSGVIEHLDMAQDECDRITDSDADQKRQRAFECSPVAVARRNAFTEACKSIDGAVGMVL